MAAITLHTFLSLDGVMQAPGAPGEDRRDGFDLGGWLVPYADEDLNRQVADWFRAAAGFLLGRRTYEIFAAHWPRFTDPADPVAGPLNSLPKYVVSTTLDTVDWQGSALLPAGDVPARIAELKEEWRDRDGELQVHGSGVLARTLMAHGLVDEYRLLTFPVVLGTGRRLFADGAAPAAMRLTGSDTTASGVTVHTYRPAGRAEFGSFALDQG